MPSDTQLTTTRLRKTPSRLLKSGKKNCRRCRSSQSKKEEWATCWKSNPKLVSYTNSERHIQHSIPRRDRELQKRQRKPIKGQQRSPEKLQEVQRKSRQQSSKSLIRKWTKRKIDQKFNNLKLLLMQPLIYKWLILFNDSWIKASRSTSFPFWIAFSLIFFIYYLLIFQTSSVPFVHGL